MYLVTTMQKVHRMGKLNKYMKAHKGTDFEPTANKLKKYYGNIMNITYEISC